MSNDVLLIEDEIKTADILKQALESEGVVVTWMQDGGAALEKMQRRQFDLIVFDLKLPGLSGDEVLAKIREIDPYVVVIVYSNCEDAPLLKKLINLGVDGFINKGADADLWNIVAQIKRHLAPMSDEEQEVLLQRLPPGAFVNPIKGDE